ncbi:hypothetical protein BVI2075_420030 [Burkholderia vietnamiensis]|nr:hypothetical protein BVI2075_420030 [Burkholderia vietnamiensis]
MRAPPAPGSTFRAEPATPVRQVARIVLCF